MAIFTKIHSNTNKLITAIFTEFDEIYSISTNLKIILFF